jgi:hypothetical protein
MCHYIWDSSNVAKSGCQRLVALDSAMRPCKPFVTCDLKVEELDYLASHVEISFRDAYLTRADMWRLFVSELEGHSIYKGQKVSFLGTIKAQIKTIYIQGRKVQSAFCGSTTKPVFRSESARFVLFIQMSKEMWDFDIDGTGEVMFSKVINGFLPDLFKRWEDLNARHLVSIILFTRMEYERGLMTRFDMVSTENNDAYMYSKDGGSRYKDFYRVLVSDMASGHWAAILQQLKREFKVFLRDVSISSTNNDVISTSYDDGISGKPESVISGRPVTAIQGNILEAINLASSQFSGDYIDRDLVRTGLSIVVITAGTGVFEVNRKLLALTTDTLVENGIGIDLVCLSRMPLHSVPLFKYRSNSGDEVRGRSAASQAEHMDGFDTSTRGLSITEISAFNGNPHGGTEIGGEDVAHEWHYAIPHWIDVSYWTATAPIDAGRASVAHEGFALQNTAFNQKKFTPRVRMYEVQMMGIMENETTSISLPYLPLHLTVATNDGWSKDNDIHSKHFSNIGRRKLRMDGRRVSHDRSGTAFSSLSASTSSLPTAATRNLFQGMDNYDETLFSHPRERERQIGQNERRRSKQKSEHSHTEDSDPPYITDTKPKPSLTSSKPPKRDTSSSRKKPPLLKRTSSSKINGPNAISQNLKPSQFSRRINFGLRGIGGAAPKSMPITEVSSETAHSASLLSAQLRPQWSQSKQQAAAKPSDSEKSEADIPPDQVSRSALSTDGSADEDHRSKPITIKSTKDSTEKSGSLRITQDSIVKLRHRGEEGVAKESSLVHSQQHLTGLSPRRAMAPWLTVLNPSNPRKTSIDLTSRLGRWHHLFPRPLSASNIKWKSLCSPAAVPLTTDDFPTKEQLDVEYIQKEYKIQVRTESDVSETIRSEGWLLRELIGARLSHGFQIVVGAHLGSGDGTKALSSSKDDAGIAKVFLAKGSTIHQLSTADEGYIGVKQYNRRAMEDSDLTDSKDRSVAYRPAVRTTLSDHYICRQVTISSPQQSYDWQRLDAFIADHEEQQTETYPDSLQFWRARFVLIPKGRPTNNRRVLPTSNEDNEEEVRLEGIRKLTHIWQKNRYIHPDERRFQGTVRKRKDTNPLDIIYQTRNPSAIVASELNDTPILAIEGNETKTTQLLPDSELFERSNLNLSTLASVIQSERGVRLMDRRWHLRLHYNCFIGMELVTWILNSFKDVDTREEAVELGNELMKEGMFQHVEKRHTLRDGNFFYFFTGDYRVPRPESRSSWFGSRRADRSIPSTPATDFTKGSPSGMRSRSSSNGEKGSEDEVETPRRQTLGVALSKKLVYDIDTRKRSYRQELITLHYDRISSADDCYHLRIDWMMATPKLIEDAIVSWATLAERNGLRLVELPIGEASRINEVHPFRAPYMVRLAKPPPDKLPLTYFDGTSLVPKAISDFPYHKAMLKKFDFVLDLEAAKDFPAAVEVTYSWGKPDYRYPQYISRSGILLVQITDEGEFLMLANRLYNMRSAVIKDPVRQWALPDDYRSPVSGYMSPSASPAIRATPDVGPGFVDSELVTPEKLAHELENFCNDVKALEAFYDEILQKSTISEPVTPFMGSTIASLGVPPPLSLREGSPANKRDTVEEKGWSRLDSG